MECKNCHASLRWKVRDYSSVLLRGWCVIYIYLIVGLLFIISLSKAMLLRKKSVSEYREPIAIDRLPSAKLVYVWEKGSILLHLQEAPAAATLYTCECSMFNHPAVGVLLEILSAVGLIAAVLSPIQTILLCKYCQEKIFVTVSINYKGFSSLLRMARGLIGTFDAYYAP